MRTAGALAIVNLQATQHDNKALKSGGVVIHARVDAVMRSLAAKLGLQVPPFVRQDAVAVGHQRHGSNSGLTIYVQSVHGTKCPTPMLESVRFEVEVRRVLECALPRRAGWLPTLWPVFHLCMRALCPACAGHAPRSCDPGTTPLSRQAQRAVWAVVGGRAHHAAPPPRR